MSDLETTEELLEPKCAGTVRWAKEDPPLMCARCGATQSELCGDFDAQEAQWDARQKSADTWPPPGVCACGAPVEPGLVVCMRCYQEHHRDERPLMPWEM